MAPTTRIYACDHNDELLIEGAHDVAEALPEGWAAVLIPPEDEGHAMAILSSPEFVQRSSPGVTMDKQTAFAVALAVSAHDISFWMEMIESFSGGEGEVLIQSLNPGGGNTIQ